MNKPTSSIRTTAGMSVDKKARSLKLRPKTKSYARRRARATGVLKILLKIGLPKIILYRSFKTCSSSFDYFLRGPRRLPATGAVYPRPAPITETLP